MARRLTVPRPDFDDIRQKVSRYHAVKQQAAFINAQLDGAKRDLKSLVQKYGQEDPSTGSLFLDLEEDVGDKHIRKLKNQRSEAHLRNDEAAEEILRGKGLWEDMVEWVPVLDESKINAAFFDKKITDAELARMFPSRVQWSFYLIDANDKPVS